jgi:nitrilase
LYCTAIFIDPKLGLVDLHRKLLPTATERLVWGRGDASTMPVVDSVAGRLGSAICWENYVPLFRTAMYAKDVQVWCAPTGDDRDVWQATMRHKAVEGRCFVVSACQYVPSPDEVGRRAAGWPGDKPLINGGSTIIGPLGDVLAEPLVGSEGLVTAQIDLDDLAGARFDLDPVGHYSRNDPCSPSRSTRRPAAAWSSSVTTSAESARSTAGR